MTSFDLDKAELRKNGAAPELIEKLDRSRLRYFRMLAEPFERRTCEAFRNRSEILPVTAIHGDAHIEQFVVTTGTYGVEDFDRAGFGPAVVDLVRYSASIQVACSEVGWPCDGQAVTERFLNTYREALEHMPKPSSAPQVVQRLRIKAPSSRGNWLDWADKLVEPLPANIEADVRRGWAPFSGQLAAIHPDWPVGTFDIRRVGALSMGFGSALERKVLLRIEGPTANRDDDLIVEAREGLAPNEGSCVLRASYGESLVLMFMSILSRRMPEIHGFASLPGTSRRFWVQSWDPGYQELSLRDVQSQADLEEVVVDAAEQLGGHLWTKFPEALRLYQRYAQMEAFDATRAEVVVLARTLALESNAAWERFRVSP